MSRTVFVGDLSFFATELHLMKHMSTAGKVASVQILRGTCGESLLHGFVKYDSEEGASRAVRMLHNAKFMGRNLVVNSTNTKAPKKPYHLWHKFTLHFTTDIVMDVTEDMLDRLCSPFGAIGDCVVRNHVPLDPPSVGIAGYAVVFYVDPLAAQRAFEFLNKATVNHITFNCSFSSQPQPMNVIPRREQNPNAGYPQQVFLYKQSPKIQVGPTMQHHNLHHQQQSTQQNMYHSRSSLLQQQHQQPQIVSSQQQYTPQFYQLSAPSLKSQTYGSSMPAERHPPALFHPHTSALFQDTSLPAAPSLFASSSSYSSPPSAFSPSHSTTSSMSLFELLQVKEEQAKNSVGLLFGQERMASEVNAGFPFLMGGNAQQETVRRDSACSGGSTNSSVSSLDSMDFIDSAKFEASLNLFVH